MCWSFAEIASCGKQCCNRELYVQTRRSWRIERRERASLSIDCESAPRFHPERSAAIHRRRLADATSQRGLTNATRRSPADVANQNIFTNANRYSNKIYPTRARF
jgi:hypothetical protein